MQQLEFDAWHMARALELAARGEGPVEPNPMVGCTIVARRRNRRRRLAPALRRAARRSRSAAQSPAPRARGATAYVTLEPCCHHGKTPPCTQALIDAGVARVVVAVAIHFPRSPAQGIAELRAAGIEVESACSKPKRRRLNAPYLKLVGLGRPWIIAKWAMTLDGKLATHEPTAAGCRRRPRAQSCTASRPASTAILVGRGTARGRRSAAHGPAARRARAATRIVLDTHAVLGERQPTGAHCPAMRR